MGCEVQRRRVGHKGMSTGAIPFRQLSRERGPIARSVIWRRLATDSPHSRIRGKLSPQPDRIIPFPTWELWSSILAEVGIASSPACKCLRGCVEIRNFGMVVPHCSDIERERRN